MRVMVVRRSNAKRCLRAFGNAMGNCLYDKTFLRNIQKCSANVPKIPSEKPKPAQTQPSKSSQMKITRDQYPQQKAEKKARQRQRLWKQEIASILRTKLSTKVAILTNRRPQ
jgi:recombination DNA repair RAD52 pathway protein